MTMQKWTGNQISDSRTFSESNCVKEKELTRMLLGGFVCQSPQIQKDKVTEEQPPSGKFKKVLFQDHP